MDEKVAVIGGTGFLGSNLVMELLKVGYTPVVVARRPDKVAKVLPGVDVEAQWGDLTDLDSLRSALQGCDVVHSVAALMRQVFTSPSSDLREATIRTNVEGTLNALRAAREVGARRVVVTSTAVARYQHGGALINEDSPPPDSKVLDDAYVRSKLLAEAATADFARETGLDVVSILPGGIVGPRDGSPTPLGSFLVECLNGRAPASIDGAFPVVDVRDVARAHVAAMEHGAPGGSYLVVARTISLREWHGILTRLTGLPGPRIVIPASMAMTMAHLAEILARVTRGVPLFTRNQVRHIVQGQHYDCSRAQRELGITFTSIETALRDAIVWYVENGWVSHPERLTPVTASV
ncbi:MAG: NAD-dependent epimerase/dehydratase family protein [Chloroflexi bacterium]|nr:NAD-dependent epimerase/dehydratase family protein [Chloroflexota bacterium]